MIIYIDSAEINDGMGNPPILVAENKFCDECGYTHDFEKCPECGAWIDIGFGLAYGGFGEYKSCQSDKCNWFYKEMGEE